MRRCPNCRRPVDETDNVCGFCDELLERQDGKRHDDDPIQDRRNQPRDRRAQRSPFDEGTPPSEESQRQESSGGQIPPRDTNQRRNPSTQQSGDRQTAPLRDGHRQSQSTSEESFRQPEKNADTSAGTLSNKPNKSMNRRTLLFAGGVVIAAGGGGYYLSQDGNNNGLQGIQNGGNNGPQRGMSDPVTVVREYRRLINEAQEQASRSNLTTPVARDIGEQLWPLIHSAAAPEADDYSNLPPDIDAVVIEHEKINIVERGLTIGEIKEKYNFGNLGYYEDNSLAQNAIVRVTYPSDRIDHFLTVTENGAWVIAALNEFTE